MTQPQLDLIETIRCCGECVHLNRDAEGGSCTPVGRRPLDGEPCPWAFPMTQLSLSLQKKGGWRGGIGG